MFQERRRKALSWQQLRDNKAFYYFFPRFVLLCTGVCALFAGADGHTTPPLFGSSARTSGQEKVSSRYVRAVSASPPGAHVPLEAPFNTNSNNVSLQTKSNTVMCFSALLSFGSHSMRSTGVLCGVGRQCANEAKPFIFSRIGLHKASNNSRHCGSFLRRSWL